MNFFSKKQKQKKARQPTSFKRTAKGAVFLSVLISTHIHDLALNQKEILIMMALGTLIFTTHIAYKILSPISNLFIVNKPENIEKRHEEIRDSISKCAFIFRPYL